MLVFFGNPAVNVFPNSREAVDSPIVYCRHQVAMVGEARQNQRNYSGKELKMWNKPSVKQLAGVPDFYSTEGVSPKEKMIHMHFFIGGCDWYAAEYDPEEQCFFGFAILNGDLQNAEWGYFSLRELCDLKIDFVEIDRDLHFKPCKAIEIENIRKAEGWEIKNVEVVSQNPKQKGGE